MVVIIKIEDIQLQRNDWGGAVKKRFRFFFLSKNYIRGIRFSLETPSNCCHTRHRITIECVCVKCLQTKSNQTSRITISRAVFHHTVLNELQADKMGELMRSVNGQNHTI